MAHLTENNNVEENASPLSLSDRIETAFQLSEAEFEAAKKELLGRNCEIDLEDYDEIGNTYYASHHWFQTIVQKSKIIPPKKTSCPDHQSFYEEYHPVNVEFVKISDKTTEFLFKLSEKGN